MKKIYNKKSIYLQRSVNKFRIDMKLLKIEVSTSKIVYLEVKIEA